MKKLFLIVTAVTLSLLFSNRSIAQSRTSSSYKTSAGLRVDFGSGSTGVGPNIKHFFNRHDAIDASLLFYDGAIGIAGEYQYNLPVKGASGLNGYFGIGPQIYFGTGRGDSDVGLSISPVAGLDYKISGVPIDLAFDWRPRFFITPGTEFTAARFGLSARFAF